VDIVADNGKLQLAFGKSRPFKRPVYAPDKAELLVGFHCEDTQFFSSSVPPTTTNLPDIAKEQYMNSLGLVKVTFPFQHLSSFLE
jgi:hypothetical protein